MTEPSVTPTQRQPYSPRVPYATTHSLNPHLFARTALIEMVPDTLSIHTVKSRSPPGTSLSDHFFAKFGRQGTPGCTAAQRRFTESMAAYSLICYLLQIKDRHNGAGSWCAGCCAAFRACRAGREQRAGRHVAGACVLGRW